VGRLRIRPATENDTSTVASLLREEDRLEVQATSGRDPALVMLDGIRHGAECWLVSNAAGEPLCIWGVVDSFESVLDGRVGCIWMLTTTHVERHKKEFFRASKAMVASLLRDWDVLFNLIDCRYERAIEWGRRIGFEFGDPTRFGVEGRLFLPFEVLNV